MRTPALQTFHRPDLGVRGAGAWFFELAGPRRDCGPMLIVTPRACPGGRRDRTRLPQFRDSETESVGLHHVHFGLSLTALRCLAPPLSCSCSGRHPAAWTHGFRPACNQAVQGRSCIGGQLNLKPLPTLSTSPFGLCPLPGTHLLTQSPNQPRHIRAPIPHPPRLSLSYGL